MQDCIGVAYTATQSTLELFKLEVNYSSNFTNIARLQQKCKIAKVQDCIGVTYTATQSTLELSAKVQDCTGVTYTATQSILGLFKLEVNYSSNCFSKSARLHRSYLYSNSVNTETIQQKCKIA